METWFSRDGDGDAAAASIGVRYGGARADVRVEQGEDADAVAQRLIDLLPAKRRSITTAARRRIAS